MKPADTSDSDPATSRLVEDAKEGDRQAAEELFGRYLPRVRQIVALRMGWKLRQFLELDALAQDVLLDIFRGLDRFEYRTEGSFRHWLASCVEYEIREQARKLGTRKRGGGQVRRFGDCASGILSSSIFRDRGLTPSEVVRGQETEERIERALLELPSHYREVIILHNLCGMSHKEIAQELGASDEQNVRKALERARTKLAKLIGEE